MASSRAWTTRASSRIGWILLSLCTWSCAREPAPIIVWIEVDTLRADALGCYGFSDTGEDERGVSPAIDALADDGILFERAYAAAPWTIPSLTTQFSGVWPFAHGANALLEPLPRGLALLPELLLRDGWRTAGVTTNFVATSRVGFERGFERFDDSLAAGHEGSTAIAAVDSLLQSADALEADTAEHGVFLWGLLFEPHFRYEPHSGRRFGPGFGSRRDTDYTGELSGREELNELRERLASGELDAADRAYLRGLYQSEVAAIDAAFARLRSGLEERGLWDRAWVVFTSDHGEEFGERGWIGHTTSLREGMLHVPWIVKPPAGTATERRGARVAEPVSQIDLFATLLDVGGVRSVGATDSESLLATIVEGAVPNRRYLYAYSRFQPVLGGAAAAAKSTHRFGVIDAERDVKWVVDWRERDAPVGELYDLSADGLELHDLAEDGRLPAGFEDLPGLRGLRTEPWSSGSLGDLVSPDAGD